MKKLLLYLIFGITYPAWCQIKPNEVIQVQPTLTHATVFLNRAELTATARTTVLPTTRKVIVDDIPLTIAPGSVQVKGQGDATITGVRFEQNYLQDATPPAAIQVLIDSLQLVKTKMAETELSRSVLEEEKGLLLANKELGGTTAGLKVAELKEMSGYFRERLTEIGTKLLKINQRLSELKLQESRIQSQLADWQNRRKQPVGNLVIDLIPSSRTTLALELSYVVSGAGWQPIYDLRVKNTQSPVSLAYKAKVYQQTGQDWNNVKLTLSTANPTQGGTKPELSPTYITFEQPQPAIYMKGRAAGVNVTQADPMMAAPTMDANLKSSADFTEIVNNDLNVSFAIALPYTITSGKEAQLVDIAQHELPARYQYYAVPKLDPEAFLVAQLSGWEKYNLVNGMANVYLQGTYLGETQLLSQNTRDTLLISLGRDKQVIVKRERVNDYSSQRTLGSNVRETLSYRITLRNTKPDPIQLVLEDQVPVSQNSAIEVEEQELSGAAYSKETGRLEWIINLKPSETRTFEIRYELKYPKGQTIHYN